MTRREFFTKLSVACAAVVSSPLRLLDVGGDTLAGSDDLVRWIDERFRSMRQGSERIVYDEVFSRSWEA